jgi:hypothetical protein
MLSVVVHEASTRRCWPMSANGPELTKCDALDSSKMTLILTARTKANVAAGPSIPLLRCAGLRQADCPFFGAMF